MESSTFQICKKNPQNKPKESNMQKLTKEKAEIYNRKISKIDFAKTNKIHKF